MCFCLYSLHFAITCVCIIRSIEGGIENQSGLIGDLTSEIFLESPCVCFAWPSVCVRVVLRMTFLSLSFLVSSSIDPFSEKK